MNNLVVLRVALAAADAPVAPKRLVASVAVIASSSNGQVAVVSDGKGGSVDLPPGGELRFEKINLAELLVRGKGGEEVFVVGNTA